MDRSFSNRARSDALEHERLFCKGGRGSMLGPKNRADSCWAFWRALFAIPDSHSTDSKGQLELANAADDGLYSPSWFGRS